MKGFIKKAFRKLSLVQKFSAAVIILIFIIMLIVNFLIISHQRGALKSEMNSNQLAVVRHLAKDSLEPLIVKDPLRLDEMVRIAVISSGCEYAGVIDRNERIVAHTDRKLLGQILSADDRKYMHIVINRGE
ncbi:MAG: hypothetical protein L0Y62_01070, partial [Nitrospirae bacterium]|nr:hypothetical protein [Nitrospirota bacterium]